MNSLFVVLDGIDGCGKSSIAKKVTRYFNEEGYEVLETAEPTDGEFGIQATQLLKEKDPTKNADLCLELFTKDRSDHLKNIIEPFLKGNSKAVVCDRYYYSTIVYQHTQGLSWDKVIGANKEFRKPDLVFILDLPVDVALKRIRVRGEQMEKFEKHEFMEELRENFLALKNKIPDNLIFIDASSDVNTVFSNIRKKIRQRLP